MRIVFLHLSDFHLKDSKGIHPAKIQAVVDSLAVYMPFEGIVIVLSGDIAASGGANQYKTAATFLGRLVPILKSKYSISEKNAKVLVVPGNHDIDWGGQPRTDPSVIRAFNECERNRNLHLELNRMQNFFCFSNSNNCFFKFEKDVEFGQLITRKILHFSSGYKIEANLINTAPFSCGADDGLHFLPEDSMQLLTKGSDADISIVVMHHSPDWFEFSQKKELENIIAQRCSLAFYGHEHLLGTQHILYDDGSRIVKQAGGAWWQYSMPTHSEYYAAIFDSDTRKYNLSKFSWSTDQSTFIGLLSQEHTLMEKTLKGNGLNYREDYIATVMENVKNTIAYDISEYFIFPTLRLNASKKYSKDVIVDKMEAFISFIRENKYVAITGGSNSGKTTLLKMLFKELQHKYIALYCGIDDITGRSQENILKELVRNTYGENAFSSFQRVPPEQKIIIIDDLHRISSKSDVSPVS